MLTTARIERELRRPAPRPRTTGEELWDELDALEEDDSLKRQCFAARRLPRVRHGSVGKRYKRGVKADRRIPVEVLPRLAADRESGMRWKDVAAKYQISIAGAYRNYQVAIDLAREKV